MVPDCRVPICHLRDIFWPSPPPEIEGGLNKNPQNGGKILEGIEKYVGGWSEYIPLCYLIVL